MGGEPCNLKYDMQNVFSKLQAFKPLLFHVFCLSIQYLQWLALDKELKKVRIETTANQVNILSHL